MSLSKDITKKRRLSLKGAEVKAPPQPSQAQATAYTSEEVALGQLLQAEPLIGELIERFGLVSEITGKPLRAPEAEELEGRREASLRAERSLEDVAREILQPQRVYTSEEVITQLQATYQIGKKRAETGFKKLLEEGLLETASGDSYYLAGSTPF